ncbi:hypothetical protein GBV73_09645 [Thermococcus sp. 101 C5]|uniref:AlbA family DNA-binding domain-containing protein n=1 Tax=Thermococcus sp. 101 C5 TaxID=2654197 RepID=UPI001329855C|nr:hypothetical protein [Thermococcus sp. 101 C5]
MLKSIVGFLNSAEGEGLLIVGVSDRKEIAGIPKDHLNKEKIRNWIRDGISSVPRAVTPPEYDIIEVDVGEGKYVYLIEACRRDDVVYFSRESGCAYVRIGDSTNRLDLNESLELVAKKSLAKPYVVFKCKITRDPSSPTINLAFEPIFRNIGSKPAFYVTAIIDITGKGILDSQAEENIMKLKDHEFQVSAGFIPLSIPVYPIDEVKKDARIILTVDPVMSRKIKIEVKCYEMEVMSQAYYEIELTPDMEGKIIKIEPTKKRIQTLYDTWSLK